MHLLHDGLKDLDRLRSLQLAISNGPLAFALKNLPQDKSQPPMKTPGSSELTSECLRKLTALRSAIEQKQADTPYASFYNRLLECLALMTSDSKHIPPKKHNKKQDPYSRGLKNTRALHCTVGLSRRKAFRQKAFRTQLLRKLASLQRLKHNREKRQSQQNAGIARRLFWASRRRLHRFLDTGQTKRAQYEGGIEKLLQHHRDEARNRARHVHPSEGVPWAALKAACTPYDPSRKEDSDLTAAFTPARVDELIQDLKNSSPGDDGITAAALQALTKREKSQPPSDLSVILAHIYNECLTSAHCIDDWRSAPAILLLKPNREPDEVRSWRHIVLTSALYRLYTAELASRLAAFISVKGRISSLQHGYIPKVGAQFHVRTLLSMLEEARVEQDDLYLTFIDLTNAFGTAPKEGILKALDMIGCPEAFRNIAGDLYSNISMWFKLRTEEDKENNLIQLERGVRQGCPLSPLIFIATMNPLLLWLEDAHLPSQPQGPSLGYRPRGNGHRVPHLSFCDDMVLTSRSRQAADASMHRLHTFCEEIGLHVNIKKCGTLILQDGVNTNSKIWYQGKAFPTIHILGSKQAYKYLGYHVAAIPNWGKQMASITSEIERRISLLTQSGLLPVQKLQTLQLWILPVPSHSLPNMNPTTKWLHSTTSSIVKTARSWLSSTGKPLQSGIPALQFTSSWSEGGFGVSDLTLSFCRSRISLALTLLSKSPSRFLRCARWYAKRGFLRSLEQQPVKPDPARGFWPGVAWSLNQMNLEIIESGDGSWVLSPKSCWLPRLPKNLTHRDLKRNLGCFAASRPEESTTIFIGHSKPSLKDRKPSTGVAAYVLHQDKMASEALCIGKASPSTASLEAVNLAEYSGKKSFGSPLPSHYLPSHSLPSSDPHEDVTGSDLPRPCGLNAAEAREVEQPDSVLAPAGDHLSYALESSSASPYCKSKTMALPSAQENTELTSLDTLCPDSEGPPDGSNPYQWPSACIGP